MLLQGCVSRETSSSLREDKRFLVVSFKAGLQSSEEHFQHDIWNRFISASVSSAPAGGRDNLLSGCRRHRRWPKVCSNPSCGFAAQTGKLSGLPATRSPTVAHAKNGLPASTNSLDNPLSTFLTAETQALPCPAPRSRPSSNRGWPR